MRADQARAVMGGQDPLNGSWPPKLALTPIPAGVAAALHYRL